MHEAETPTKPAHGNSHPARPWVPWTTALVLCVLACLGMLETLHRWQLRERKVLEEQANAMVHALASSLRVMGARLQRSDEALGDVLADIVDGQAIRGVALVDQNGRLLAGAGLPEERLADARGRETGSAYFPDDLLVWDTVDVGSCRGWGRGFHGGRQTRAGEAAPMKLFISMPLHSVRSRWHRDSILGLVVCIVAFVAAVAVAATWSLARRSATYSEQLRLADEEKRTLAEINLVAAGLAHEIKNPLGVVRGTAQHLAAHPSTSREMADSLGVMLEEIDCVASRVNELLSFANPREPVPTPVRLREELKRLERLMATELADAGLSMALDGVPSDAVLLADPDQLRRVLFNLVHNAIRFAPGSGAVAVSLARAGNDTWTLALRDHGPGIPPELRQRVFSAYFTTSSAGTGLGLAAVRRAVGAHGWTISCDEAPAGGALFTIRGIAALPPQPTDPTE